MKPSDARRSLLAVLGMGCAVVAGGCASSSALEDGLLARASDGPWRAEAWVKNHPPVLRVWAQGSATPLLENHALLPPDLGKPQAQWQLQRMDLKQGRLVLALRYRPQPGTDAHQDKRFEFDLSAPGQPLVHYRVATMRGGKSDWQTVDFILRKSQLCRNAPQDKPDDCQPIPAVLADVPVPTLASIGSAEEFVPSIKMETRY